MIRLKTIASLILLVLSILSCGSNNSTLTTDAQHEASRRAKFSGNYNRAFNDMNKLHLASAKKNGITPLELRADTINHMDKLMKLPDELDLYRSYQITHSIPYLVPSAAKLFVDIAQNFRDSLYSKKLPLHKIYLTSITRTDDDIIRLRKRNINASKNSAHRYATTFDISWKRFDKIDEHITDEVTPQKLKLVLAEVLFDLKHANRCYVKHERRQACFHITVREEE